MRHGPPCSSAWWKRATLVMAQGEKAEAELQTEVLKLYEDICARSGLSRTVSHHFTMYTWQTTWTICVICITLWILQRLRARGKGNSVSNVGVVDLVKSKGARKIAETSIPLIGATESKAHQYDVFINHRGPDVKRTFVAHLDAALRRNGFRPFLDAKEIEKGRHVFNSIDKALKDACVHVAIFSKGYAESKYCLNELCDMLKSGKDILPIFYHVKPEDLRWIKNGPFKKGFEKHIKRGRVEEVEKWQKALLQIVDYRGFRLDEVNGNEEQLIRSILVEVQRLMPMDELPRKSCYGLAESKQEVLNTLNSVSVVGLVGMGGIGKTTLAEEVYNHFVSRRQFERYCFLRDVRSSELSQLQHKLLKDLGRESDLQCISAQEYKHAMDVAMCQRVLVIVDDIDDRRQFENLIPDIQLLGSDSRVVITSRQRNVLIQAMKAATSQEVFEVPPLNKMDSRHLFNRHAFLSETSSEWFADLAVEVADACGGHALSLETMGASLFDKKDPEDRAIWMEAAKALQENEEVFGKLRSTYDRLPSDGDKAMFRDIACTLIGTERVVAMRVWESCKSCSCRTSETPALALRSLMDRSLVKVDENGILRMHDVLRDMGRDIMKKAARGPEEWTYLWDATTATKVLKCRKKNNTMRGISLANVDATSWQILQSSFVSSEASQLTSMDDLHFLILDGCRVSVPDGFSNCPRELRLLQWRGFCSASLPSHLILPSLVVLDLRESDKLIRLWEDGAHVQLPLLETLDLSDCSRLEELGENVGESIPKLKRLVLHRCWKLRRLPESIGHLTDLEHLDLSFCPELVSLPDGIVGLVSLRRFKLSYCPRLQKLPEELGKLSNLETLDLCGWSGLCELPTSIDGLKMLTKLDMFGTRVRDLPSEFGLLSSLTTLHLPIGLRSVPETFEGLEALTFLEIFGRFADVGVLGTLTALKELHCEDNAAVTILPRGLGNLKWLVQLRMRSCPELLVVEAFPEGLEGLGLSDCPKLTEIPSLARMRYLVKLDMNNCPSLKHVDGLECLTGLEDLDISGCTAMEGRGIRVIQNRALRWCHLGGSKVGVAYDNRWLEREPAVQVISWLGDAIPVLSCRAVNEVIVPEWEWTLVMEAIVTSKAECIALIWCILCTPVGTKFGESRHRAFMFVKVEVWRSGRLVMEDKSFAVRELRGMGRNKVCLSTWRREHGVVQSLQYGDMVSFHIKCFEKEVRVVEGGVCMVHREDENLVMAMNSELLDKTQSEHLSSQFGCLVLEDSSEESLPELSSQKRHIFDL